jgi:multidrug efflux pump subunit AcrB
MGAIMSMGVATANSVLVITFARNNLRGGDDPLTSAWKAGVGRLRPVLMTSMAAAFGMLPLAYGIGSGADMLRPLAIAVIGALCISVLLSLVATPAVYLLLVKGSGQRP